MSSALERLDFVKLCGTKIFLGAKKAKTERNANLHLFSAGHIRVLFFLS